MNSQTLFLSSSYWLYTLSSCYGDHFLSPTEPSDQGPMYQDPATITRTPHPETGEIYTEVKPDKKKRKKAQKTSEESGPVYQVL